MPVATGIQIRGEEELFVLPQNHNSLAGTSVVDLAKDFGECGTHSEGHTHVTDQGLTRPAEQELDSLDHLSSSSELDAPITETVSGDSSVRSSDLSYSISEDSPTSAQVQLRSAYPHLLRERRDESIILKQHGKWHRTRQDAMGLKTLDEFGHAWAERFISLAVKVESDLQKYLNLGRSGITERAEALGKFLLRFEGQAARIFELWKACLEPNEETVPFLLCLVSGSPSEALKTLFSDRTPPFYNRVTALRQTLPRYKYNHFLRWYTADALDFIADCCYRTRPGDTAVFDELYAEVMNTLAGHKGLRKVNQMALYTIIKNCTQEQVTTLYNTIESRNIICHPKTRAHFAHFFALNSNYKRTMEISKQMVDLGADPTEEHFQITCLFALRRSMRRENGYHDNPWIIAAMLEIGIPMNTLHYAVIMANANEAKDHSTVVRTYNLLKEHGQTLKPLIFRIVLMSCISSYDAETFQTVRRDVKESGCLSDDILAGTLLCASYVFLVKEHDDNKMLVFHDLIKLYCDIFDSTPLADLQILPASTNVPELNPRKPTSFAVGVMLCAFVRAHMAGRTFDFFMLEKIYRNFRKLVEQGHELAAPIVRTTHVANTFIYAIGKSPKYLRKCLDMVSTMTTPLPPTAICQNTGLRIKQAQPCVYTWSILINSFSRSGQNVAARRVLEIMQERGVEPNVVTWSSLTHGYSKSQDATGLLDALLNMEASDVKMDRRTLEGLQKFRNKQALRDILDQAQTITSSRRMAMGEEANLLSDADASRINEQEEKAIEVHRSEISRLADALQ
ncbi:MAG: hypothetical protein M1821_006180 [Bathelium mastoideum]|nr:MAG: hypothetical protein M1821_006180 [Bathelium mastoideum]KAI9686518.1 MAG: hypothetical protein M1822_003529 [Bathelium mastoideum]